MHNLDYLLSYSLVRPGTLTMSVSFVVKAKVKKFVIMLNTALLIFSSTFWFSLEFLAFNSVIKRLDSAHFRY